MIGGFFFFLLIVTVVSATSHNNNNFNNHNYCLNREISFDPNLDTVQVEGETESSTFNFYHNTEAACDNNNNNNNNNKHNVSNHNHIAMFIHGGAEMTTNHDQPAPRTSGSDFAPFVSMSEGSFMSYLQDRMNWDDEDLFDDDDEDDDDDDDNDGHSSMLSNASIRRRVSSAAAATTRSYYYNNGNNNGRSMMNSSEKNGNSLQRSISLLSNNRFSRNFGQRTESNTSSSALNQVLKVRGGASGVALADDFAKRLVAAALITVLFEGMIGHVLEFFKIAMQTAPVGTSYYSILKSITQEKGIAGAWDGFVPWGVVQSVAKGGVFGLAHAVSKEYLSILVQKGVLSEQIALTMAGGIAGGFQGFVLSPLLLLKTRVMTNPVFREKMSALKTTYLSLTIGLEVVKNEGLLALMKGADVFSLKRVFDWSTRYYFSDFFKAAMLQNGFGVDGALTRTDKIVASLMGGTASTLCTLPLDVIVAKSQDAKKAGVKVSAWETFMKDYKEGGMKGLYDANMMGFEARLLHVCLTTVVMQMGSPMMYEFLFGNK